MSTNSDRLTYKEAILYCGLKSGFALRRAVRRRELQQIRVSYRIIFFEKSELDRWMSSKKSKVLKCNISPPISPPKSLSSAQSSQFRSQSAGLAGSARRAFELDEG